MEPLPQFQLPLTNQLPDGYHWEGDDSSVSSTTSAFNIGINQRDQFLGHNCCIICGESSTRVLQHCHIIQETKTWSNLQIRGWIPSQAKEQPQHDPHNGLLLCSNHHIFFNAYKFFIRFVPDVFIFVNYSDDPSLQKFHGKAIPLDMRDRHAPFPSLFIIHEMCVRGFQPFAPLNPDIPKDVAWQDWILSDGVFDDVSYSFKRNSPPDNSNSSVTQESQPHPPATMNAGGESSGIHTLAPLNADMITEILTATYASPSWKACQMEGTSWTGTAEENIEKYVSSIGVETDSHR